MPPKDTTASDKNAEMCKEIVQQTLEKGFTPDMQRLMKVLDIPTIGAARIRWHRFKKGLGIEATPKGEKEQDNGSGATPSKPGAKSKKRSAAVDEEGEGEARVIKKARTSKKKVDVEDVKEEEIEGREEEEYADFKTLF
jgi:hypothetical protein